MAECRASKRARQNNCQYHLRQSTIEISEADREEITNKLNKYLYETKSN